MTTDLVRQATDWMLWLAWLSFLGAVAVGTIGGSWAGLWWTALSLAVVGFIVDLSASTLEMIKGESI